MEIPPLSLGDEKAAPSTLKVVDVPYEAGSHTYLSHSTLLLDYKRQTKRDGLRFVWGAANYDELLGFLASHAIEIRVYGGVESTYEWRDAKLLSMVPGQGVFEFDYAGASLVGVVKAGDKGWYIGCESMSAIEALYRAVKAFKPRGSSCMVYGSGSGWEAKNELIEECRRTKLDRLTFPKELREDLRSTLASVFGDDAARTYDRLGLPRKRGVILHGPPGNGKTSVCKAVVAELSVSLVYVSATARQPEPHAPMAMVTPVGGGVRRLAPGFPPPMGVTDDVLPEAGFLDPELREAMERTMAMSFRPSRGTGQSAGVVEQAYKYAQQMAPCVVVLEEIDSMVEDGARGALLTALDGLVPNEGVLTIATTNHLDSLDDAIRNRPSRFDRVLHLPNPSLDLRERYLEKMAAEFASGVRGVGKAVRDAARATDGMSFAHLQEIVLGLAGGVAARERPVIALAQSVERVKTSFTKPLEV